MPCRFSRPAGPPATSVAVLDFQNVSRDTADAYLSEGLAEELTVRLGQVARLTIASRAAVRRLRGVDTLPVPHIGRSLHVSYLVTGSVRRSGTRLRVSAELLRASDGAQVWTSQYDRSDRELLGIEEAIAIEVASGVVGRLLPAERATLAERPTRSMEAYEAYLRGRVLYQHGISRERAAETIRLFERAVALDPRFADAWSMLSRSHGRYYVASIDRSAERLAQIRSAAERAVALAPAAASSQLALGYYHYWAGRDYEAALRAFSAALAAQPNDVEVHNAIANVARRQGRWDLSQESRAHSIRLDPTNVLAWGNRADSWIMMRRFEEARADIQRALPLVTDSVFIHHLLLELALATGDVPDAGVVAALRRRAGDLTQLMNQGQGLWRATPRLHDALDSVPPPATAEARLSHYSVRADLLALRRSPEAPAVLDSARSIGEELVQRNPNDDIVRTQLATTYARLGRCDEARGSAQRAVELLPVSRDAMLGPDRLLVLAQVEAICGGSERAVDLIEQLLAIPSRLTIPWLRADPVWAALRGNPRFDRLTAAN